MKKVLALICALVALVSCGTVRISMDTHLDDGDRVILTSDVHLFGDISVALGARIDKRDTVLAVLVTYDGNSNHGVFESGDKMQIRFRDQHEMVLTNIYQREFETGVESYTTEERRSDIGWTYSYDYLSGGIYLTPVEVSSFVPKQHFRTVTKSYALYFISKPQLLDIIANEVVKLRVEIENNELDTSLGTVSYVFANQYNCLKERFKENYQRSKF